MLGACEWGEASRAEIAPKRVSSPLGQQFAEYLLGAMDFYDGDFPSARRRFEVLRLSRQEWLRETAVYLVGRVWLNEAQQNAFDEWGYPTMEAVDPIPLAVAGAAFDDYLLAHPGGRYAASAKGLERRIAWLMQDGARLAAAYAALLANGPAAPDEVAPVALAQEIDGKLLMRATVDELDDPRLLAVAYLMQMRAGADAATLRAGLESRRAVFAAEPALLAYLQRAVAFYAGEPVPDEVGPPPDRPLDYLAFSSETLRGLSLERKGEWKEAETVWLGLLPRATRPLQREQLELALAMNWERSGRLDDVFASASPVRAREVRSVLLRYAAGPALLRREASGDDDPKERDVALFTLLYKDLLRGRYGDFVRDVALLPVERAVEPEDSRPPDVATMVGMFAWPGGDEEGYACPPLREVARALQRDPKDPVGLNCLGEFVLRNDLDGFELEQPPPAGELGSTVAPAWGKPYSRLDGYMQVMADATARPEDRAYALYRAVNCYAPSGYNDCGTQEIAVTQRREWFRTLKRRYPRTWWAENLEYYW
jgi:hypothetical protein